MSELIEHGNLIYIYIYIHIYIHIYVYISFYMVYKYILKLENYNIYNFLLTVFFLKRYAVSSICEHIFLFRNLM